MKSKKKNSFKNVLQIIRGPVGSTIALMIQVGIFFIFYFSPAQSTIALMIQVRPPP